MPKKLLIKGPLLSRSGYGEQSRFALRAFRTRPDLYDIYIINIPWGRTGQLMEDNEETQFINQASMKAVQHMQQGGQFDVSLQITVPNEFEKIAPINIGYTAGIETSKVAPQWIDKSNNNVDKVIVISNHSKNVFESTRYDVKDQNGNEVKGWGLQVPVDVINYSVRKNEPIEQDLKFRTTKNFLAVSQWGPRKNLDNTIRWFVEAFRHDEDVGLIVKTNTASDSIMDREFTTSRLESLLKSLGDKKCSIYLLHGEISQGALAWLYEHPTMKALINIGHGEGFGLPLFEAACHGLPLITTTWSGQNDFICKPNKKGKRVPRVLRVDYNLEKVQKSAVWPGIIQEDALWAFAKEASYKRALKECLDKETHWRNEARTLQKYILEEFAEEKMYKRFVELANVGDEETFDLDSWLDDLEEEVEFHE
jgi:glycosyltransferase involved in cell wall biosynthesis